MARLRAGTAWTNPNNPKYNGAFGNDFVIAKGAQKKRIRVHMVVHAWAIISKRNSG